MKKAFKFAAVFLAAAALQLSAIAAPILDQSNPGPIAGFCFTHVGEDCGQSFRQDHSNISGAGFFIDPASRAGDGTVTISIFGAYDGSGPSGLIASGTSSPVSNDSGWVDVFWAPAAVTIGAQYYMVIDSTQQLIAAYAQPVYLDGQAVYAGSTIPYTNFDLAFRTYFDDGALQQVPEPGSFALFAIAIAGLGFTLRKKRVQ